MSSIEYWADLHPDKCLRRAVLVSGIALLVAGVVMISMLDLSKILKVVGGLAWAGISAHRLWQYARAYALNGKLRIRADESLEIEGPDGQRHRARLCSGSFATRRFAWLRVAPANAAAYGELLRGDSRQSEEWRRFQVIWRHIGAHS